MEIVALLPFILRDFSAPLIEYFVQVLFSNRKTFLIVIVLLWTTIFSPMRKIFVWFSFLNWHLDPLQFK
jgi:hypothetical protein